MTNTIGTPPLGRGRAGKGRGRRQPYAWLGVGAVGVGLGVGVVLTAGAGVAHADGGRGDSSSPRSADSPSSGSVSAGPADLAPAPSSVRTPVGLSGRRDGEGNRRLGTGLWRPADELQHLLKSILDSYSVALDRPVTGRPESVQSQAPGQLRDGTRGR